MIKKLLFGFICLSFSVNAQINDEALDNFANSAFQDINQRDDSDVTIIFDRTYVEIKGKKVSEVYTTVHRKIKIHSLFGLEHYNKLYIPIFNDLNNKLEFVACKAKTLKKNKNTVATNNENIVTTTLPANAPFLYKVKGKVKMLAIKDVNIGDEIEYIYTTKQTYDSDDYFYKADKIEFGNNIYCLEKSLFINTKKHLNVNIWPYNFHDGTTRNSDFLYENGYKVSLKNIQPNFHEIYSQANLHNPYLFYEIKSTENKELNDTWEDFAKYFKPKRQDIKKNYVLNGQSVENALDELNMTPGTQKKYQNILSHINKPIENDFHVYEDIKDDIEVAWSYAKVISKTAKKLNLPINFHFVISKNNGKLEKSLVSLYQFDTIICSFQNEDGSTVYFPLLEPYSNLNDIRKEYQQTECFTIKQDLNGKRTHGFDLIPLLKTGNFQKKVHITLNEIIYDTLKFTINESLKFNGHSWLEIKPLISYMIKDSLTVNKKLKSFVENQIVLNNKTDSIYNLNYSKKEDLFTIDYQYNVSKPITSNSPYFSISPNDFFEKDFFTPYYLKNKRINKGYFTNEFNTVYLFSFEGNCSWQENKLLKASMINEFGSANTTYTYNNNKLETSVKLNLEKAEFESSHWSKILDLRETIYDFLNAKFYFKISNDFNN